jgi:hypothetical protein
MALKICSYCKPVTTRMNACSRTSSGWCVSARVVSLHDTGPPSENATAGFHSYSGFPYIAVCSLSTHDQLCRAREIALQCARPLQPNKSRLCCSPACTTTNSALCRPIPQLLRLSLGAFKLSGPWSVAQVAHTPARTPRMLRSAASPCSHWLC